MGTTDVQTQAEQLVSAGARKVRITYIDGSTETVRVFKGSGTGEICRFRRRSRRYGYPLNYGRIQNVTAVQSRKSPEKKWKDAWEKVVARLKCSQLWENLIPDIEIALSMGYERLQKAKKEYWEIPYGDDRDTHVKAYLRKYPELETEKGENIKTDIVWHYSELPKVKKMRFTKYRNDDVLERIQIAMDRKEKLHLSDQYSYDVSFEYNPETNRAWYSEEFRGCGNGHYFLALDATHAIFWEDD